MKMQNIPIPATTIDEVIAKHRALEQLCEKMAETLKVIRDNTTDHPRTTAVQALSAYEQYKESTCP